MRLVSGSSIISLYIKAFIRMGRPPKALKREDGTYPISSLAKDPVVRDFMNEYWAQQKSAMLPIPRDKTKIEYVNAPPLLDEEQQNAYREREGKRLLDKEEVEEKQILRSNIDELHEIKRAHLQEIEDYRKRCEMYEATIRHFLDKEKENLTPSTIYTAPPASTEPEKERYASRMPYQHESPYNPAARGIPTPEVPKPKSKCKYSPEVAAFRKSMGLPID